MTKKATKKLSKSYKNRLEKYNFGRYAERYTMIWLWLKGYKILKNRYQSHYGEIDIIAFKNKQIVFVEVKARLKNYHIENILNDKQINRIKKSANYFIGKNKKLHQYSYRFDFVEVKPFFGFILKVKHQINFLS